VHVSHSIHTRRFLLCFAAALSFVSVVLSACGESGPAITAASPLTATVSGHVYQRFTAASGEPLLANVAIRVNHSNGSVYSARTNRDGFYEVAAAIGSLAVTVQKNGYETKTSEMYLSGDTVLNFSIASSAAEAPPVEANTCIDQDCARPNAAGHTQ